jgi:hypothetical protein
MIPGFVEHRIRQEPPGGVRVVPGSTPVVSFGNYRKATVATLGWNPSRHEFLDRAGRELDGEFRRLHTHRSIGQALLRKPGLDPVRLVLDRSNDYFQGTPYHWFNKLERVLNHIGASYWNGTACHLDLVQWATDPVWSELSEDEKDTLLNADIHFLRHQLRTSPMEVLLLNGRGIINAAQERLGIELESVGKRSEHRAEFFVGQLTTSTQVVGWSTNLQSSRGVSNDDIRAIMNRVSRLL